MMINFVHLKPTEIFFFTNTALHFLKKKTKKTSEENESLGRTQVK